jgi:hypothetical protein
MSAPEHYWQFHQLNGRGEVSSKEILSAREFIQEQCADIVEKVPFSDTAMEQRLFAFMNRGNPTAEICLRCYISSQIRQVCLKLAQQFGENHQFKSSDLSSPSTPASYRSFITLGLPTICSSLEIFASSGFRVRVTNSFFQSGRCNLLFS